MEKKEKENYILYSFFGSAIIICLGIFFGLRYVYIGITLAVWLFFVPDFVKQDKKNRFYEKRFMEAEQYVEHMLYAFQKSKKILPALLDTGNLFEAESDMGYCIQKAVEYIQKGEFQTDLYQEALAVIGTEYGNVRILELHTFMTDVEKTGGNFTLTAEILLEDKKNWCKNVFALQQVKNKKFAEVAGSSVMMSALCIVLIRISDFANLDVSVLSLTVEQMTTTLFLIGQILCVRAAKHKVVTDWLFTEEEINDKKGLENYQYLIHFNQKKEKIHSVILSLVCFVGGILFAALKIRVISIICLGFGFVMLFQHRLNYQLSYRQAKRDVLQAYPKWLLHLLLLLQNNNVQVSLQKSYENAPTIMKPELLAMTERIAEEPTELSSYTEFFAVFKQDKTLNVMQDMVKILYSMSVSGEGNMEQQMKDIMSYIYQYREIADHVTNQNILSDLENMMKMPMVIGIPKTLVDMYVLLCVALPSIGNYLK